MGKRVFITILVFIIILSTGCWDRRDIEQRAYVYGISFDKPDPEEIEKQRELAQDPELFTPRYSINYLYPVPSVLIGNGPGEDTFITKGITAPSPETAEKLFPTRIDLALYFGHTNLVLLGEEIIRDAQNTKVIMDYMHRNQEFNWNVSVAVVSGKAKDAFAIKPMGVTRLANYIVGIMENKSETSRVSNVDLKEMMAEMAHDGTMVLPRITVAEDEVKVEGAALIKNFKLVGYFTGQEARALMFLKGRMEGGGIVTSHKDILVPYTIVNASLKRELNTTEEGLEMIFKIESEGQLEEGSYGHELLDDKVIKEIQSSVEWQIEEDVLRTIEKLQKNYKADVIGVGEYIEKIHPRVWKEVEDDWQEEGFPSMNLKVEVEVNIRRVGVIK